MRRRELENIIYVKNDAKLMKFLKRNFMAENVTKIEFKKNMNTYESLDSLDKNLLISRLHGIEEKNDLTSVFIGMIGITLGFVTAYGNMLKIVEENEIGSQLFTAMCYGLLIFLFAYILTSYKNKKAVAKYYINLFKSG